MKVKVAIFTGTRAEYGLLHSLMSDVKASARLQLQVVVGGMHLSPEFGDTWKDIERDGFPIDAKVEMLLSSDSDVGVVKSIGVGILGFADALDRLRPDVLVVLGDRFEALAIVQSALIMKIPVAHLHGGEVTEGAYDDAIRHAISKLSYLHFVSAEPYRQRVIQLGESPDRVFNVGAIGIDHLKRTPLMGRDELSESLQFDLSPPFFLVTYHPVTLAEESPELSFKALLEALDRFPEHKVIITYPNADNGGRAIIPMLEAYAHQSAGRVLAIPSLGFKRYLSVVALADAVVGNSSSGIIEVPSFHVPTVNIGVRQKGRLAAKSVFDCKPEVEAIVGALRHVLTADFELLCQSVVNPYGCGDASKQIVSALECFQPATIVKPFYDLS
ncbi:MULTISPECIES: UDP-N-acetylglucosamine 2-epimerase [unclassified Pseudomonas]|uniref:UDP-N-acetylglucosamine 2-epimerase n=1 Tax=unclassified Pseudomonas TaxID=196821 RepID=UPI0018E680B2|nr:UDP-N-acetylglucosamine 2-epimerase [Pseudomonas sp. CCOS 191]MBI6953009.1 UDP-N-acetylglucosamine 2-epimerase (hydrolyzing) [Pseudomonas sp. CCOS 191]